MYIALYLFASKYSYLFFCGIDDAAGTASTKQYSVLNVMTSNDCNN